MFRALRVVFLAALIMPGASPLQADDAYPTKPITIVVPFAAGNSIDMVLRLISDKFQQATGVPFIIDNRGGASGITAASAVSNARPDGYTLLATTVGQMSLNPLTFPKLPYDPDRSFTPITQLVSSQYVFAANARVPATDLESFVAWVKSSSAKVSFASTGMGTPAHFAGVMLNQAARIDMTHVPYRGGGPGLNDLLGSHIETAFTTVGIAGDNLKSDRLRVYAVTSEHRIPALPDVPTFVELGFPEVVAYVWAGLAAPAGTPQRIVNKLHYEIAAALVHPEVAAKIRAADQEPVGSSPADFAAFMKHDRQRWRSAVQASGFKPLE